MNDVLSRTARPAALAAALAVSLFGVGCTGDHNTTPPEEAESAETAEPPPLDEPADAPATTAAEETAAPQEDELADPTHEGSAESSAENTAAETETDNGVLDVTEFSAEPQKSNGFPNLLTEVPEDSDLLLREVRVGIHEGYHRIVFDHAGAGAPGWSAEYVDEAVEPGSGFPIEMHSESILYVGVVGLEPGNAGQEDGHLELEDLVDTQGTVFSEAITTFVHHGSASYYIGLDVDREYRVSVWEHPEGPRLIIDVLV